MNEQEMVKKLQGLQKKKHDAELRLATAQANLEASETAATKLRTEVKDRFGKSPKELDAWAKEEHAALEAELTKLEATDGKPDTSTADVDI